jgi:hypothetical protein
LDESKLFDGLLNRPVRVPNREFLLAQADKQMKFLKAFHSRTEQCKFKSRVLQLASLFRQHGPRYNDLDEEIQQDVQWCKDNNFFQVGDELWSGPWYYERKKQMIADKKESEECIKEFLAMGDDIKEKADYVFPSKKDSTNFHKTHVCKECNKHFQSFYLMHCHMRTEFEKS